jgi:hypothetical protein
LALFDVHAFLDEDLEHDAAGLGDDLRLTDRFERGRPGIVGRDRLLRGLRRFDRNRAARGSLGIGIARIAAAAGGETADSEAMASRRKAP